MKKLFAWILLAVMAAGLTACGNTGTQETTGTSQEETRTEVSQEDTKPADTQEEAANGYCQSFGSTATYFAYG